jgi:hypothetical protein
MNEGVSRTQIADAVGLHIQELHASGRLQGSQPLLKIDNRDRAVQAPFQFDAARGQLHRAGCRAIPRGSMSALYGVWKIAKEEEALACPRCKPMSDQATDTKPDAKPGEPDSPVDLLFGVLSVVSQFGGVLRERGQEYRNSRAGALLGGQIEKIYNSVNEREKGILDLLASSLGSLAVAVRDMENGLNDAPDAPGPRAKNGAAAPGATTDEG